jgi:propanediol dehydratase large subunit
MEEATSFSSNERIYFYAKHFRYGTETVLIDGGDTAYSKAFLASAYASRGIKIRFTSGTGSEVLMGNAEQKSMLYLEVRCLFLTKACGVQGIQNGSINAIPLVAALPNGFRHCCGKPVASMMNIEVVRK